MRKENKNKKKPQARFFLCTKTCQGITLLHTSDPSQTLSPS